MYTNWLIQTFLPITTPRNRCSHGRKLNPPGAKKAILPASLLRSTGSVNGLTFHFRIEYLELCKMSPFSRVTLQFFWKPRVPER
jgi:hypothetical protein